MEIFALKPKLCFGAEPLSALDGLSGKRVMVVTDAFLKKSGLLDRVTAHLGGCTVQVFDRVEPDPSLQLVAQGVKELKEFLPDVVIGFGGGSPMDCAKAMCWFGSPQKGSPSAPSRYAPGPELWCIPTTAGTGSEVTSFAVLTDTEKGVKYPVVDDALLPVAAILDAGFLEGVPPAVTADTGMDVLTHAAEGYVAKNATPFTDALAEKAFSLAYHSLPAAHRGDMGAKADMLYASCLAGIAFNAAGLGVCHSMAHALGGKYHVPHGRLNAMLLPHVVNFNSAEERAAEKYARLAKLCSLAANPRALASALTRLRVSLGMPAAIPVPAKDRKTDQATLSAAALADICLPGNPRVVTARDLENMIKEIAG
ncbi:MAG: iron-containing alcohol dehydrogenase [Clostridia bacterium]|nr:iron-containing alcohol dehydrogenase [Clostridia bacterium]